MKKFKSYNTKKLTNNIYFYISIIILVNFLILFNVIGKKITKNIVATSKATITNYLTNKVNDDINASTLKKYNINDLITLNYNQKKIVAINYNLNEAYQLMQNIKNDLNKKTKPYHNSIYKSNTNNDYYLSIPIYNYTSNYFLANLGPKIKIKSNIIQSVSGNIKTKIKNYGINTSLIELYIEFDIKSTIIIPFEKKVLTNKYEILISSKVIEGDVPSLYQGLFESKSSKINI